MKARLRRIGLGVFALLALLSACADLLASDLPLWARWRGRSFWLPCVTRPALLADVDNQRLRARLGPDDAMLAPPIPYGPNAQKPGGVTVVLAPPSARHWLGTDDRGRDVAARLLHGTRVALVVGLGATLLAALLALCVGGLAALGRAGSAVAARLIDIGLSFPTLFLLLLLVGLRERVTLFDLTLAIALTQWPHLARLVRAETLRALASPHTEAARALGVSGLGLAWRHLLPFARPPLLVACAFSVGQAVWIESGLSLLGLGAPPPLASWGELLRQAEAQGLAGWLLWPPTVALALTVLAANLVATDD